MNLTTVKIQQIKAVADVQTDEDFRQPRSGSVFASTIQTLRCQINYNSFRRRDASPTGDRDRTSGRLVFKKRYLAKKGVTLQKGDKVIAIRDIDKTDITVAWRISEVLPQAHLPTPGLIVARFERDREERDAPT